MADSFLPPVAVPPITFPTGAFLGDVAPYSNVTPYTHRDMRTMQGQTEALIHWVNHQFIEWNNAEINRLVAAVNYQYEQFRNVFIEFTADTTAQQAAFERVVAAAETLIRETSAHVDAQAAQVNEWREHIDAQKELVDENVLKVVPFDPETRLPPVDVMLAFVKAFRNDFVSYYPRPTDDTSQTAQLVAAMDALPDNGGRIVFPEGVYYFDTGFTVPANVSLEGTGRGVQFIYRGTGEFIKLSTESRLLALNLHGEALSFTLVHLFNVFRTVIQQVTFSGGHVNATKRPDQTGLAIRGNAGDSQFIACRWNNLGAGIRTDSIMDYVMGATFSSCGRGIYGDGNNYGSGISVSDTTFVSNAETTIAHVEVAGNANKWWFTNTWMEGCSTGVIIGDERGGPYSFGMVNMAIAATVACIVVKAARQTSITNVSCEHDVIRNPDGSVLREATPVVLSIDKDRAPDGTVVNLLADQSFDLDPDIFPTNWTYVGRDKIKFPPNLFGSPTWKGNPRFDSARQDVPGFTSNVRADHGTNTFEFTVDGTKRAWQDQYGNLSITGALNVGTGVNMPHGVSITEGDGDPRGNINAGVGSIYIRRNNYATDKGNIYINTGGTSWLGIA
jgi:hypothetical protein